MNDDFPLFNTRYDPTMRDLFDEEYRRRRAGMDQRRPIAEIDELKRQIDELKRQLERVFMYVRNVDARFRELHDQNAELIDQNAELITELANETAINKTRAAWFEARYRELADA